MSRESPIVLARVNRTPRDISINNEDQALRKTQLHTLIRMVFQYWPSARRPQLPRLTSGSTLAGAAVAVLVGDLAVFFAMVAGARSTYSTSFVSAQAQDERKLQRVCALQAT